MCRETSHSLWEGREGQNRAEGAGSSNTRSIYLHHTLPRGNPIHDWWERIELHGALMMRVCVCVQDASFLSPLRSVHFGLVALLPLPPSLSVKGDPAIMKGAKKLLYVGAREQRSSTMDTLHEC